MSTEKKFPDDGRNRGYPTSRVLLHLSHPIQGDSSKPPFRHPSISFSRSAISPFRLNRGRFLEETMLRLLRSIKVLLIPLSASEHSKTDEISQAVLLDGPNECIFEPTTCDRHP